MHKFEAIKKKKMTGDILMFKLHHDLGFAYCKIIDFTTSDSLTTVVVKVYNVYDKGNSTIEEITSSDYLLNPIRIYEYPNRKGRGAWKYIGNHSSKNDKEKPIFKQAPKINLIRVTDESECERWWAMRDFYKIGNPCQYNQIGHLESMFLIYKDSVITRASMEIIKLRGNKIEDFYDVEDLSFRSSYLRSINVPFMKDIPKNYRNKVLDLETANNIKGIPFRSKRANPKSVVKPIDFPKLPTEL